MSPRWPRPMGAIRSITRREISEPSPESTKGSWGLTEIRSWKCGKGLRLFRREPYRLRHFNEYAAPASTVTSQAFHLRAVPQAEVPCDCERDNDVVAVGQVVLGDLPDVSPDALGEFDDSDDRRRGPGCRDRGLSGIPRPSRSLLRLGSVGPVVSVGVSMAPRMSRAVPHRPPACRGSIIVSSGT